MLANDMPSPAAGPLLEGRGGTAVSGACTGSAVTGKGLAGAGADCATRRCTATIGAASTTEGPGGNGVGSRSSVGDETSETAAGGRSAAHDWTVGRGTSVARLIPDGRGTRGCSSAGAR